RREPAAGRMVEIDDRSALAQMRIVERLGGVEHRAAWYAAPGERLHDLALVMPPRPAFDDFGEGRGIAGAGGRAVEAVVVTQIRPADDLDHRFESLQIVGRKHHVDILVDAI